MLEMFDDETREALEYLRNGSAFEGTPPRDDLELAVSEAAQVGLEAHREHLLLDGAAVEFAVVERTDFEFDDDGIKQPVGKVLGDVTGISAREWLTAAGRRISVFGEQATVLPAENDVRLSDSVHHGELEFVLRLTSKAADLNLANAVGSESLLYCDSEDPAVLTIFRGLASAVWRCGEANFFPLLGVAPLVGESLAMRTNVGSALRRMQPPMRDRFLRIPVDAIIPYAKDEEVRITVKVGRAAAEIRSKLNGCLRLNCFPVWNAVIASTESTKRESESVLTLDMQPLVPTQILILDCYDPESGTQWHDARYATCDPAFGVQIEHEQGRVDFRFRMPPPIGRLRVDYLAWLEPPNLSPGEFWMDGDNQQFVVKTSGMGTQTPTQLLMGDYPKGMVSNKAELHELIWRLMPVAIRREFGTDVQSAQIHTAPGWSYAGDGLDRIAQPTAVVTLPRIGTHDLSLWLEGWAKQVEQYLFDRHVEIRIQNAP